MVAGELKINEIFFSIQGESTWAGMACIFVRLSGCPLRCKYCDTSYAFNEGSAMSLEQVIEAVASHDATLVEITGGEPLIQPSVHPLMEQLCDRGYTVLLETSGERDIEVCDRRVIKIVDIKTPCSGAADSFLESNFKALLPHDELKFVITNKEDFDWAVEVVTDNALHEKVKAIHLSPVMRQERNTHIDGCEQLDPETLAGWILESSLPFRLQFQLHKFIWSPTLRGV
jgi:7-carboxy-7-deazaguanine synthase